MLVLASHDKHYRVIVYVKYVAHSERVCSNMNSKVFLNLHRYDPVILLKMAW